MFCKHGMSSLHVLQCLTFWLCCVVVFDTFVTFTLLIRQAVSIYVFLAVYRCVLVDMIRVVPDFTFSNPVRFS